MDSGKPEGCFGGLFKPKKAGLSKKNIKRNLRSLSRGAGKNYPVNPSDYSLYEEVGVSSTAKVYRALCVPFKEVVAIKVLDLGNWNSNLVPTSFLLCINLVTGKTRKHEICTF
jgi:hypothetical protein